MTDRGKAETALGTFRDITKNDLEARHFDGTPEEYKALVQEGLDAKGTADTATYQLALALQKARSKFAKGEWAPYLIDVGVTEDYANILTRIAERGPVLALLMLACGISRARELLKRFTPNQLFLKFGLPLPEPAAKGTEKKTRQVEMVKVDVDKGTIKVADAAAVPISEYIANVPVAVTTVRKLREEHKVVPTETQSGKDKKTGNPNTRGPKPEPPAAPAPQLKTVADKAREQQGSGAAGATTPEMFETKQLPESAKHLDGKGFPVVPNSSIGASPAPASEPEPTPREKSESP
jgi:hypothetical protein